MKFADLFAGITAQTSWALALVVFAGWWVLTDGPGRLAAQLVALITTDPERRAAAHTIIEQTRRPVREFRWPRRTRTPKNAPAAASAPAADGARGRSSRRRATLPTVPDSGTDAAGERA